MIGWFLDVVLFFSFAARTSSEKSERNCVGRKGGISPLADEAYQGIVAQFFDVSAPTAYKVHVFGGSKLEELFVEVDVERGKNPGIDHCSQHAVDCGACHRLLAHGKGAENIVGRKVSRALLHSLGYEQPFGCDAAVMLFEVAHKLFVGSFGGLSGFVHHR